MLFWAAVPKAATRGNCPRLVSSSYILQPWVKRTLSLCSLRFQRAAVKSTTQGGSGSEVRRQVAARVVLSPTLTFAKLPPGINKEKQQHNNEQISSLNAAAKPPSVCWINTVLKMASSESPTLRVKDKVKGWWSAGFTLKRRQVRLSRFNHPVWLQLVP